MAEQVISYDEALRRFPTHVGEVLGALGRSRSKWRHAPPGVLRWRISHCVVFEGCSRRVEARLLAMPPTSSMRYGSTEIVPVPKECRLRA